VVLPAVWLVSVSYRYWPVGILVGIFFDGNYLRFDENPLYSQKGGLSPSKRWPMIPFLEKKGFPTRFLVPKCTDQVFLRYQYGKYQENTS
jgi:hypothetical protein